MNLNEPTFSDWLCGLVSQLQENLAATEYYIIKLHPDPQKQVEEGSLYRVPAGVSVLQADDTLAHRFGWMAG